MPANVALADEVALAKPKKAIPIASPAPLPEAGEHAPTRD
jgi:hypothetical protein